MNSTSMWSLKNGLEPKKTHRRISHQTNPERRPIQEFKVLQGWELVRLPFLGSESEGQSMSFSDSNHFFSASFWGPHRSYFGPCLLVPRTVFCIGLSCYAVDFCSMVRSENSWFTMRNYLKYTRFICYILLLK